MQERLFHYTTQKGLLGIIKNKSLWFTNIFYLNDSEEIEYTFKLLQGELEKKNMNELFKFMKDISDYKHNLELVRRSFYVFSFSSLGEDLNQWRAYGDDGGGYCIEFDFNDTVKVIKEKEWIGAKCLYNVTKQKEKINEMIDGFCNKEIIELIKIKYQALPETDLPEDEKVKEIRRRFFRKLLWLALKFKHPAFEPESELRMYIVAGKAYENESMPLKFRQGKKMLIPYLDLKIPESDGRLLIRRIIIGPTNHPALSKIAVEDLLRANSMDYCKVETSDIPYRGKL